MRFAQLEYEITQCEKHLVETNKRNTEAESYLVRYLLVRICAEYEARILALVKNRCARTNDQHLRNFAHWGAKQATKYFKVENIDKMLANFGSDYRDTFNTLVKNQTCSQAFDNIYTNRHTVAHGTGPTPMSFGDLKRDFKESVDVIEALATALCMKQRELKGLS
jgi:hypothetical protein